MSAVEKAFRRARSEGRGALIGFITAGDPSPRSTVDLIGALVRGGADIVELGVPFSDPVADGVTIQASSQRALGAGMRLSGVLEIAREAKSLYGVPVVLLSYLNPLYRFGVGRFLEAASSSGVDGLVVPDLPPEEADDVIAAAKRLGVCVVFLATPTTSEARLERIVRSSSGFVYLVSLRGVTGAREELSSESIALLKRVRRIEERPPVAVGFGISRPEHVGLLVRSGAEGVIVGSALVKIVEERRGDVEGAKEGLISLIQRLREASFYAKPSN